MRCLSYFFLTCLILFSTQGLHAHIIHVPADSTTIQGGINGAVDGDTVLVADGTYTGDGNRDIRFHDKSIFLMSENGPEVTIIDCEGDYMDWHRGFNFPYGEDSFPVVEGFTIINGYSSDGGGILCSNSSPTISNLIITECRAYGYQESSGGGIYIGSGSNPIIRNCTFISNESSAGGGLSSRDGNPTITNCTFSYNSAGPFTGGGGMSIYGGNATVINCTFTGNSGHGGGGLYIGGGEQEIFNCVFADNNGLGSCGGGIYNESSEPTITSCIFSGNTAYRGGGIFNSDGSNPTVTNCTFSQNVADEDGGGMSNWYSNSTVTNCTFNGNSANIGGGIRNWLSSQIVTHCIFRGNWSSSGGGMYNDDNSTQKVTNCTFSGNSADFGGGMYNYDWNNSLITNCTFSGNTAGSLGGGMYNDDSSPIITNCIFWKDLPDEIDNVGNSNPIVNYCDVKGGWTGEGNINEDPLFVSFHGFDYLLGRDSPCIDAGDPALEDGRAWPIWYNNGLRSDMGAYGGPGNVGWLSNRSLTRIWRETSFAGRSTNN